LIACKQIKQPYRSNRYLLTLNIITESTETEGEETITHDHQPINNVQQHQHQVNKSLANSSRPKRSTAGKRPADDYVYSDTEINALQRRNVQSKKFTKSKYDIDRLQAIRITSDAETKARKRRIATVGERERRNQIKATCPDKYQERLQADRLSKQVNRAAEAAATQIASKLLTFNYSQGQPTPQQMSKFESDPLSAMLRFADASGFNVQGRSCHPEGVLPEAKHLDPISSTRKQEMANEYVRMMNPSIKLEACASCGMLSMDDDISFESMSNLDCNVKLKVQEQATTTDDVTVSLINNEATTQSDDDDVINKLSILELTGDRLHRYSSVDAELQACFTVFKHNGKLYNLHSSLIVHEDGKSPCVPLCAACLKSLNSGKLPRFNVGNGYDFGIVPADVSNLSLAERIAVSENYAFMHTVKFSQTETSGLTGHVITFDHDGPQSVSNSITTLPRLDVGDILTAAFVGTRSELEVLQGPADNRLKLLIKQLPQMRLDVHRVGAYLRLKHAIDPNFAERVAIDFSEEIISTLQHVPEQIVNNTMVIDDEDVIAQDIATGANVARTNDETATPTVTDSQSADVASSIKASYMDSEDDFTDSGVQHTQSIDVISQSASDSRKSPNENVASSDSEEATLESVFVCKPVVALPPTSSTLLDSVKHIVDQPDVRIHMQQPPINEFGNNDQLLLGHFGHMFLLGEGVRKNAGTLNSAEIKHLLMQHDGRFSSNADFVFLLFNQKQRHAASRTAATRIRGDNASVEKFRSLINSPDFSERLDRAIQSPDTEESKRLLSTILNVVRNSGETVPWSELERKGALKRMTALMHYAGPFSFFATISPADMDSTIMLRLASKLDPSLDDGHVALSLPSLVQRHKILARNPFAAALVYRRLIDCILEHLVGLKPDHLSKKCHVKCMFEREDGIFGVPIAYAGVHEVQGRQSVHFHVVITSDISPTTIQALLDDDEQLQRLMKRLDSIVQAWVPEDAEANATIISTEPCDDSNTPAIRDPRTLPCAVAEDGVEVRGQAVAFHCNNHRHGDSCRKGAIGRYMCRFSKPSAAFNLHTRVLQLEGVMQNGKFTAKALKNIENNAFANFPGLLDQLLSWQDNRVVVIELFRPGDRSDKAENSDHEGDDRYYVDVDMGPNCSIVSYSPLLSGLLGCNTDISPLGSLNQSKGICYYLLKYMTKDGNDLANSAALIATANNHIHRFPSRADDATEFNRISQYLLTRILNCLTGAQEFGGQLASLCLLDVPSNVYSHKFSFCNMRGALKHTLEVHANNPPENQNDDVISGTSDVLLPMDYREHIDVAIDDVTLTVGHSEDDCGGIPASDEQTNPANDDSNAFSLLRGENGSVETVSDEEHYRYRPTEFEGYSFYFFNAICCVLPKPDQVDNPSVSVNGVAKGIGRNANSRFSFQPGHKMFATHEVRLKSKHTVPMLVGLSPPRHPGPYEDSLAWRRKADHFAAYLITLHYPWDFLTGAPLIPLRFESLLQWTHQLHSEGSNDFIAQATLNWMRILAQGVTVSARDLRLMTAFRSRKAQRWGEVDVMTGTVEEFLEANEQRNDPSNDDEGSIGATLINQLVQVYDSIALASGTSLAFEKASKTCKFIHCLDDAIRQQASNGPSANLVPFTEEQRYQQEQIDEVATMFRHLCTEAYEVDDDADIDSATNNNDANQMSNVRDDQQPLLDFSQDIMSVVQSTGDATADNALKLSLTFLQQAHRHADDSYHHSAPVPLKLLIQGAAGTGKSYFVGRLVEYASLLGEQVVTVSAVANAASLLPGGRTFHDVFAWDIKLKNKIPRKVAKAQERIASAKLFVVDEISLTSAAIFAKMDERLRLWRNNSQPFGGVGVILMGDFFQIAAVGRNLIKASRMTALGVDPAGILFNLFNRVNFTTQFRAAADEAHAKRLEFFRNPSLSQASRPIRDSCFLDVIKTISAKDVCDDPLWLVAPVVVADNMTRFMVNHVRAVQFAIHQQKPVIAWRHRLSISLKKYCERAADLYQTTYEAIVAQHEELTFYFVQGAPAMLRENLATTKGLTNGSTCRLASLTLNGDDVDETWHRINSAAPGEIVMLERPPLSVNVFIATRPGENWPPALTLSENNIIIPILESKNPREFRAIGAKQKRTTSSKSNKSKVDVQASMNYFDFGMSLAFAVTYHKIQGQTLDRVILDLNSSGAARVDIPSFYVGVSRVREGKHIRMLPMTAMERARLLDLEFNKDLLDWYRGTQATS